VRSPADFRLLIAFLEDKKFKSPLSDLIQAEMKEVNISSKFLLRKLMAVMLPEKHRDKQEALRTLRQALPSLPANLYEGLLDKKDCLAVIKALIETDDTKACIPANLRVRRVRRPVVAVAVIAASAPAPAPAAPPVQAFV
jgi:hypothetical protein